MKIEIDPLVRASPLAATEQPAIEGARGGEIVDWESEMEERRGHRNYLSPRGGRSNPASTLDCIIVNSPQ
jgi:hypothetical protein